MCCTQKDFRCVLFDFFAGLCYIKGTKEKGADGDSKHRAKAKANRGEWKPGASSTFAEYPSELQAEPLVKPCRFFHRYRKRVCWYAAIGGSRSNVFVLFAGRRRFFVFDSERRFKSRNACGKRRRVWFHKKANLLQEDFDVLYDKVSANLNFIEREKAVEKFWEDNQIFEKEHRLAQKRPDIHFMTARRQPTENPISAMWKHAPLRI